MSQMKKFREGVKETGADVDDDKEADGIYRSRDEKRGTRKLDLDGIY